jgi:uroporphyrin-3 C-methyltransferase
LAALALLIALGAAGGSGYLWYMENQKSKARDDQAAALDARLKSALGPINTEVVDMKEQLASHQSTAETLASGARALQGNLATVQGDLQTLKAGLETQKGDAQVWKQQLQTLQDQAKALQAQSTTLEKQIADQAQSQKADLAQLATRTQNLQLAQRGLLSTLDSVKEVAARGGDINALPLSEVEYLLRIANYKLELEQDVEAALNALTVAQKRLQAIGEEDFNGVLKMMDENIASLRGVQLPDRSALAHKIVEIESRLENLPLSSNVQLTDLKDKIKPKIGEGEIDLAAEEDWLTRFGNAAMLQLKDILVIRNERSSGPPLIAAEEKYFLVENLRLQLEAMRVALLSGDATHYQESNELARNWLDAYFDPNDTSVEAVASELKSLQTVKFTPYIPDISDTVRAFRDVMERRQPVRSVVPSQATSEAGGEEATQ